MIDTDTETQPEGTYWHFLAEGCRLRYDDGRKVVVGETLRMDESPILCERGFHASERVIDALSFAPGPIVCLVTLGGTVLNETKHAIPDKSVAQERTALWIYDATHILREFACDVAEEALLAERKAGREPDPCLFDAIEVMRRFMTGDASETERNSAQIAAWSAARSTSEALLVASGAAEAAQVASGSAYSAAYSAAKSAAWEVAWNVAMNAAYRAEYSAGNGAAWSASESAALSEFNERLTQMLLSEMAQGKGEFAPSVKG